MRIISREHDYYDGCMHQHCDRSIVFNREMSEGENVLKDAIGDMRAFEYHQKSVKRTYRIHPGILFFCGQVYPFLEVFTPQQGVGVYDVAFCYRWDELALPEPVKDHAGALFFTDQWLTKGDMWYFLGWRSSEKDVRLLKRWGGTARKWSIKPEVLAAFALAECIPYFALRITPGGQESRLVRLPILQEIGFQRVIPAITAFQSIQQYITNELAREKDMKAEPIPDEVRAATHGFDEWSFRREPEK